MEEILLNVESKEVRYARLKNGQLSDLIVERNKARQLTGNIYRGKVINILHNIQSAFVDIDEGENGFIHISDIIENTQKFEKVFDMDFDLDYDIAEVDPTLSKDVNINEILKLDQAVLVQVVKEPIGSKGARLTSNISLAGRYLVLLPNTPHKGVSRKIEDRASREKLKKLLLSFELPKEMGMICRTASKTATVEALAEEAKDLYQQWLQIVEKFNDSQSPCLLFQESSLIKRAVITAIDKKFDRLLIDDYHTFQVCKTIYSKYRKEHCLKIEYYRDKIPMLERFNVEREIDKTLRRKIWTPSGGYLFFDRTEAMYTIDVNSGRSQSNEGRDVEETIVRINLEAAEEIARQLRLRNIGGLIICDFIDMRSRKNQRRVFNKLKECMKEDSAKCTILNMSEFGLVEMTRQRSRESLIQMMFTQCPYCAGSGLVKTHESVSIEIERCLKKVINYYQQYAIKLVVHPELYDYLSVYDRDYLKSLSENFNANLKFDKEESMHVNDFRFFSSINGSQIDV